MSGDKAVERPTSERSLIDAFDFFECKPLELEQRERLEAFGRSANKQAIAAASSAVEPPDRQLESCDEICVTWRIGALVASLELVGHIGKFPVE